MVSTSSHRGRADVHCCGAAAGSWRAFHARWWLRSPVVGVYDVDCLQRWYYAAAVEPWLTALVLWSMRVRLTLAAVALPKRHIRPEAGELRLLWYLPVVALL